MSNFDEVKVLLEDYSPALDIVCRLERELTEYLKGMGKRKLYRGLDGFFEVKEVYDEGCK